MGRATEFIFQWNIVAFLFFIHLFCKYKENDHELTEKIKTKVNVQITDLQKRSALVQSLENL